MSVKYQRVRATPEEVAEHRRKHGGQPRTYRYECRDCGKRLWGSGLGIGSHNRACAGPVGHVSDKEAS